MKIIFNCIKYLINVIQKLEVQKLLRILKPNTNIHNVSSFYNLITCLSVILINIFKYN